MLEVNNLYKKFNLEEGLFAGYGKFIYAVNGVSLKIIAGETYGLVGESGCGKSTLSRLIAGIYKQDNGEIKLKLNNKIYTQGESSKTDKIELRKGVRYIFQDPAKSLDPRMNVGDIIIEGLRYTNLYKGKKQALKDAEKLLELVGLNAKDIERRPGEFSGGQRQRISIARALITNPKLLVCDEVVSALDVSVQSQIINLLIDIKNKEEITIIFISHDLGLVSYISDRVGVMYGGMIVEEGESLNILEEHKHPYTKLLYGASLDNEKPINTSNDDEVSNITRELNCCPFLSRCSMKMKVCENNIPMLKPFSDNNKHKIACFLFDDKTC